MGKEAARATVVGAVELADSNNERVVLVEQAAMNVEIRTETGSSKCRRLRRSGRVPAVIYGHGKPARSICLEEMELNRFLARYPLTTVIRLTSGDKAVNGATVMIKKLQRDPSRGRMLHADFQEISMSETVTVSVPVVITGLPKNDGGVVEQLLNEISIESVVASIPPQLAADISGLGTGDSLRVSDLQPPEGVKVIGDLDQIVVRIVAPRAAIEEERTEEAEVTAEVQEEETGEEQ
jgi:large subunit ribosomal protein L25